MTPPKGDIAALNGLLDTSITLLKQLETALSNISKITAAVAAEGAEKAVGSLVAASQAAQVIKGSTSKLSLLIISEPFTPSAITKVTQELVNIGVPILAGSAQSLDNAQYTTAIRRDLANKCERVLRNLRQLLEMVPRDGKVLPVAKRKGVQGAGSFTITGSLWAACDEITRLAEIGAKGRLIERTEELRDTLKDQMEELKEWGEEEDDDGADDGDDDNDASETQQAESLDAVTNGLSATHLDTQAMVDDLMNGAGHIPKEDPDQLRPRLAWCLRILKQAAILYSAIIKYRLRTLPAFDEPRPVVSQVDDLMKALKKLPNRVGDLAAAFYDLSPEDVDRIRDQAFQDIFAVTALVLDPWEGERDTFSDWILKLQKDLRAKPEAA